MRWREMVVICMSAVVIALGIVLAQPLQAWWIGRTQEAAPQRSPAHPAVAEARAVASPSPERSPGVPTAPLTTWTAQAPQRAERPVSPPPAATPPVDSAPAGDPPNRGTAAPDPAPADRAVRPPSTAAASATRPAGTRAAPGALTTPPSPPKPGRPQATAADRQSTVSQESSRTAGRVPVPPRDTPPSSLNTAPAPGLQSAPPASQRPAVRGPAAARTAVPERRPATPRPTAPARAPSAVTPLPRRDTAPRPAAATQVQPPRRVASAATAVHGDQIEVVVPRSPPPAPASEAISQQPSAPVRRPPVLATDGGQTAETRPSPVDELLADQTSTEAQDPQPLEPTETQTDPAAGGTSLPAALDARGQGRALTALLEQGQWNDLWKRLSPAAQARWGDLKAFQAVWIGALGQAPRLLSEAVVEDEDGASYSRVVTGDSGESWSVDLRLDADGTVQDIQIVPAE